MRVGASSVVAQRALAGHAGDRLREIGARARRRCAGSANSRWNARRSTRARAARRRRRCCGRRSPRDFSTTPTAKPARSYSPAAYMPGMLGRLAADQRAAGLLAAARDALDDLAGDGDVELAAGEVVEEEQRLGALDQDVVDAHRDEVDADRVVAVERERELELGADAVGARRPAPARDSACRSRSARRSRRCRRAPRGAACGWRTA